VDIKGRLFLQAVYKETHPNIIVRIDSHKVYQGPVNDEQCINFAHDVDAGEHQLTVEFDNKTDPEMAVIIHRIEFFEIASPKFIWRGVYRPRYPESYVTEHRAKQITVSPTLTNCNYLGWNGTWTLTFTAPIFIWIHQVEDLGWMYT
jgi:hypothetical protein